MAESDQSFTSDREPKTSHDHDVVVFLRALTCAVGGRTALYVSAPLTSGRRFAEWRGAASSLQGGSASEHHLAHFHHVVTPNRAAAAQVVSEIRRNPPTWIAKRSPPLVVIDPTALPDFVGWQQDDYRVLWARVIEQFAQAIVFLEGWHYSSGCAYEFLTGARLGIEARTGQGDPMTAIDAIRLLRAGIADLGELGADTTFLEWVAHECELVEARLSPANRLR